MKADQRRQIIEVKQKCRQEILDALRASAAPLDGCSWIAACGLEKEGVIEKAGILNGKQLYRLTGKEITGAKKAGGPSHHNHPCAAMCPSWCVFDSGGVFVVEACNDCNRYSDADAAAFASHAGIATRYRNGTYEITNFAPKY